MQPPVERHTDVRTPYLYTNYCVPDVASSALHLAAYNGRTATFQRLLRDSEHENVHRRTADRHYSSPLTVALARGHTAIADICLQHVEHDLAVLAAHFERIGGSIYASRFWLRGRILIALGADHVRFVRDHCGPVEAVPADMTPAADGGSPQSGLVILLKSGNASPDAVVWLTARQPGDDRLIGRIVGHIVQRGGELNLRRRDIFRCTDFDVAARQNHTALWMRVHAIAGVSVLDRRSYANSFRHLAEHVEPPEARAPYFADLCRRVGGFEVAELFAESPLSYDVLHDAVVNYTGVTTLLDYLINVAADGFHAANASCTRAEAVSAVFNQSPADERQQRLFGLAFGFDDNHLPWFCVRYRPNLAADREFFWQTDLMRLLTHRYNSFDADTHALIVAQFGGWSEDIQRNAFGMLCRVKWLETVRALYALNNDVGGDADSREKLLVESLESGAYAVAEWLMQELPIDADRRLSALAAWLKRVDVLLADNVPESLWSALLAGEPGRWDKRLVSGVLCQALDGRHWPEYQRIWTRVERAIERKGNGNDCKLAHSDC